MTEVVADTPEVESQEPDAPATPPEEDVATIKKRLAGKDQALTRAQQEAKDAKAEAEVLRRWKAEKEQADMTEVERLQAERDQARAEAARASREAELARLAAKHPKGYQLYEDIVKVWDDPQAAIEVLERLAAQPAAEAPEAEPLNLADRPRRAAPAPASNPTAEDLKQKVWEQIKAMAS